MLRIAPPGGPPQPGSPQLGPPPAPMSGPPGPPMPGPPPPMPGGPPIPPGGPDDATDSPEGSKPKYDAEKAPQAIVVYRDPSMGPFACGNCRHFDGEGSCAIVQGGVEAAGLCNLFESAGSQDPNESPDPLEGEGDPPLPPPQG